MKNSNKKGFTLVELLVVIAILAILATVAVVGYTSFIDKANESADMQAITQMNNVLYANDILEDTENILVVFDVLSEAGLSAKDYHPLAKDMYFFWDANLNEVLYVDENMTVVAPEKHAGKVKSESDIWLSLTQKIATEKPEGYSVTDNSVTVTVANGAQMLYVLEQIEKGSVTTATITIPETGIDMMGASFGISNLNVNLTIQGAGNTPAVIKNVTAVDTTSYGDGTNKEGQDGQYAVGLFGTIPSDTTLTIKNVIFENVHIKNTHASGVGILVGINKGKLVLNNVTIKNSSVIGHRNVGAIVGNGDTLSADHYDIENVSLENVDVKTVGGRSGLLFGMINIDITNNNAVETAKTVFGSDDFNIDEDCSYTLYECEQNTGTSLGLQEDGVTVKSWAYDNNNNKKQETLKFFEGALVTAHYHGEQADGSAIFE